MDLMIDPISWYLEAPNKSLKTANEIPEYFVADKFWDRIVTQLLMHSHVWRMAATHSIMRVPRQQNTSGIQTAEWLILQVVLMVVDCQTVSWARAS